MHPLQKLSSENRVKMIEGYKAGATETALGKQYGISTRRVGVILKKEGVLLKEPLITCPVNTDIKLDTISEGEPILPDLRSVSKNFGVLIRNPKDFNSYAKKKAREGLIYGLNSLTKDKIEKAGLSAVIGLIPALINILENDFSTGSAEKVIHPHQVTEALREAIANMKKKDPELAAEMNGLVEATTKMLERKKMKSKAIDGEIVNGES